MLSRAGNVSGELRGLRAFSRVASRLAIRGKNPKSKVVAELYGQSCSQTSWFVCLCVFVCFLLNCNAIAYESSTNNNYHEVFGA